MNQAKQDKQLRIASVVNSISPGGGVGKVSVNQCLGLTHAANVTIITSDGELEHSSINVVKVPTPNTNWMRRFGHVAREIMLCSRLIDELIAQDNQQAFDAVIFHSHISAAVGRKRLRADLACCMVVHGDIYSRPKGTYDFLLTRLYKFYSKRAYRSIDLIIALSEPMQNKIINYGADRANVCVIPNGLKNNSTQACNAPSSTSGIIKLLFVGRLSHEKDPLSLIAAIDKIDVAVHLTIIGSGSLEAQLQLEIEARKLSDKVCLTGQISPSKVSEYFEKSHIICVPSIDDPLPTVVLEAMQMGRPVIATNVDGIPSMVSHGETGLLYSPGDNDALVQAIEKLSNNPELRKQMGLTAHKHFMQKFELRVTTGQLIAQLEALIK